MNKNIVFLIWNTKKCGGNKVVFEYANGLQRIGNKVIIFSVLGGKVSWYNLKVKIIPLIKYPFFNTNDIIIATFWPTTYIAQILRGSKKYYFVLGWEPEYYKNPLLSFAAKMTYLLPLKYITISKYLKNNLKSINKKAEISVIPLNIDTELFRPRAKKEIIDNKKDIIRVLSVVSSYQRYKGIDILVNLIKKLKKNNPNKYSFVLVSFEQEPYSPIFDEFISRASNERLVEEYQKADVFLATPRVEGFFLPGLEAMACGCPVIMTESGGILEYAKNYFNCILISEPNKIIKNNYIYEVATNENLREKLIQNGLITANNMSKKKSIKLFNKILK